MADVAPTLFLLLAKQFQNFKVKWEFPTPKEKEEEETTAFGIPIDSHLGGIQPSNIPVLIGLLCSLIHFEYLVVDVIHYFDEAGKNNMKYLKFVDADKEAVDKASDASEDEEEADKDKKRKKGEKPDWEDWSFHYTLYQPPEPDEDCPRQELCTFKDFSSLVNAIMLGAINVAKLKRPAKFAGLSVEELVKECWKTINVHLETDIKNSIIMKQQAIEKQNDEIGCMPVIYSIIAGLQVGKYVDNDPPGPEKPNNPPGPEKPDSNEGGDEGVNLDDDDDDDDDNDDDVESSTASPVTTNGTTNGAHGTLDDTSTTHTSHKLVSPSAEDDTNNPKIDSLSQVRQLVKSTAQSPSGKQKVRELLMELLSANTETIEDFKPLCDAVSKLSQKVKGGDDYLQQKITCVTPKLQDKGGDWDPFSAFAEHMQNHSADTDSDTEAMQACLSHSLLITRQFMLSLSMVCAINANPSKATPQQKGKDIVALLQYIKKKLLAPRGYLPQLAADQQQTENLILVCKLSRAHKKLLDAGATTNARALANKMGQPEFWQDKPFALPLNHRPTEDPSKAQSPASTASTPSTEYSSSPTCPPSSGTPLSQAMAKFSPTTSTSIASTIPTKANSRVSSHVKSSDQRSFHTAQSRIDAAAAERSTSAGKKRPNKNRHSPFSTKRPNKNTHSPFSINVKALHSSQNIKQKTGATQNPNPNSKTKSSASAGPKQSGGHTFDFTS